MAAAHDPALTAGDDIHQMLLGMVMLDALWQLTRSLATCPACESGRKCEAHWTSEAQWAAYDQVMTELRASAGSRGTPLSPATLRIVAAAARTAAQERRRGRHRLDQALAAAYEVLFAELTQAAR